MAELCPTCGNCTYSHLEHQAQVKKVKEFLKSLDKGTRRALKNLYASQELWSILEAELFGELK